MRPSQFAGVLAEEFGFPKRGPQTSWRSYLVQRLDFTGLHLSLGPTTTPVLIDERLIDRMLTAAEVEQLRQDAREYLQEYSRRFCILITCGHLPEKDKTLDPMAVPDDFAIIDAEMQAEMTGLRDIVMKQRAFGSALTKQVGVLKMSPYALEEPAEAGRFFGRTLILRKILAPIATRCFLLIGPRRIGKTSILLETKRQLQLRQPDPARLRIAHIIGSEFRSSEQVVAQIVSELEDRHPDKVSYKFETRTGKYRSLPDYVRRLTRGGRCKVAIFIDEVDKIIQFDEQQDFECLSLLRSMVLRGSDSGALWNSREKQRTSGKGNGDALEQDTGGDVDIRIYMAGFRHAFRAHTDPRTPLYGFAEPVEVSPLLPHDAQNMIRVPLNNLGLSLPDVFVESILQESASHPQLVSVLCSQILRFYDAENRLPAIEDFQPEILRSSDFERRMVQTFLASTNVFEMSACLLLVRRAKELQDRGEPLTDFEFDFWIVKDLLAKAKLPLDAKAVMTICHNLRLSSVITTISGRPGIDGRLRFFIPQLVKVIANMDLNALLQDTLDEARRRQRDWAAVFDERDVASAERLFGAETARSE